MDHYIDQTDIFFAILRKFGPILADFSLIVEKTILDQTGNHNPLDGLPRRVYLLQGAVVVRDMSLEILVSSKDINDWFATYKDCE